MRSIVPVTNNQYGDYIPAELATPGKRTTEHNLACHSYVLSHWHFCVWREEGGQKQSRFCRQLPDIGDAHLGVLLYSPIAILYAVPSDFVDVRPPSKFPTNGPACSQQLDSIFPIAYKEKHGILKYLVLSCLVLSYRALSCLVLSCLIVSCLVLNCVVLSCRVLSCLAMCK